MKDPTAWMDDLAFYMDDRSLAETAATIEPTLLYRGSKAAAGAWIGLTGIVGGAFGGVTLSPAISSRWRSSPTSSPGPWSSAAYTSSRCGSWGALLDG